MNNLEKVKRQLARPISIKITNESGEEDEFMFKPLNIEQQAIMMELGQKVQSRKLIMVNGKEVPELSKEDVLEMESLVLNVVQTSIPELEEEVAKDFVSNNFSQLSNSLEDLMPKEKGNLDLIKKKLEEARNEPKE